MKTETPKPKPAYPGEHLTTLDRARLGVLLEDAGWAQREAKARWGHKDPLTAFTKCLGNRGVLTDPKVMPLAAAIVAAVQARIMAEVER